MRNWMMVLGSLLAFLQVDAQCLSGDCMYGYGKKRFKSGAVYTGQFKNGQINGEGKLKYSNGGEYVGQWKNNLREGRGQMKFVNGDVYQGRFVKSTMTGKGFMDFANGDMYDGQFRENAKHGYGIYKYVSGDKYAGYFQDNYRHGKGTMTYKNGSEYTGDWSRDAKHGQGVFIDENGFKYEGDWANGEFKESGSNPALEDFNEPAVNTSPSSGSSQPVYNPSTSKPSSSTSSSGSASINRNCNRQICNSGLGTYIYSDYSVYKGEFKNGKPHGQGKMKYKNGDIYEGGWAKHAPHGLGVMESSTGQVLRAEWNYGKPIRILQSNEEISDGIEGVQETAEVKVWAVIVGVSRYQHLQSLKYTDDDAYRMYAFLKSPEGGALQDNQIRILIDEDATRTNMMNAMRQTFSKADKNDVVMLYFSGHGLKGAFVPSDYDGQNNRVFHDEILGIFESSQAKHKVVFADACHSGSMLAMKSPNVIQQTIDKYYDAFAKSKGGTALLLSSKGEETSLEDTGLRQGIFSHFLMRGLKGEADNNRNKTVSIQELFDYVYKEVTKYTIMAQTPTLTGDFDKQMPVAIIR